ncbi:non-ribosomal peptide synthetase [Pseudovibrio brasiliensis]|uniref:Amino acid adenylation domain-containing protein n=1 Tax=Pseudovibrio brasiliensis TaxID=1898042 RepID=A0ABX8AV22_9HYPH|nr:non-ribosomal peptide synthetase [Pseudovibrio brasiliensis]QUS58939.1 amino acid adenylation domain-containing protein [Pseudovibrio brasiliensis]
MGEFSLSNVVSIRTTEHENIVTRIEQVARIQANKTALVGQAAALSYGDMVSSANRLAGLLQSKGIGPEVAVGVRIPRGPDAIIAFLAILKAGGVYVPLDSKLPHKRLEFMVQDSEAAVLLCTDETEAFVKDLAATISHSPKIVNYSRADHSTPAPFEDQVIRPDQLAYIIYTSGSTGQPKGVMVEHRGLHNLAEEQARFFELHENARVLQFASLGFDASISEILVTLCSGAELHFAPNDTLLAGDALREIVRERAISHLTLPPSLVSRMNPTDYPSLETLVVAGEAMPWAIVERWSDHVNLINAYGPTENTVCASLHRCSIKATSSSTVPIGNPIANVDAYVLDADLKQVRDGDDGALWLGGLALARGYKNRPDLTNEMFRSVPGIAAERLYNTGDRVRRLADGSLEFLGRLDAQVKVRGHRIELQEIEKNLSALEGVEHAHVVVSSSRPKDHEIIAYFTVGTGKTNPGIQQLKTKLRAFLPDYMMPNAFVRLNEFPLTVNGKVDSKALPAPDRSARGGSSQELPRTNTEQSLAGFWKEVLGVNPVFCDDTLQTLGGSSLDAVQFLTRCREEYGNILSLKDVFTGKTLCELAEIIQAREGLEKPEKTLNAYSFESDTFPVSHQQNGVCLLEKLTPDSLAYNAQCLIRIEGDIDVSALQSALDLIVQRHEIFRSTFHEDATGKAYQRVHGPVPARLDQVELDAPMDSPDLWQAVDDEVSKSFDTSQLPLARWVLFKLNDETSALLHIEHHLVHDGWSANIFLSEFLEAYGAFAHGEQVILPPVPAQYRHYVGWQQSTDAERTYEKQLAYWKEQLSEASFTLALPTDAPRPETMSFKGKQSRLELKGTLLQKLNEFCDKSGHTDYTVLLGVFHLLLSRYTGQKDLLTGSAVANRKTSASEHMLGMFVNSVAIRSDLSKNPIFTEYLEHLRSTLSNAYENEEVPFERVVRELQPERDLSRNPIFQVGFSYHNSKIPKLSRDDLSLSLYEAYSNNSAKFDIEVVILPRSSTEKDTPALTLLWNYATDLFQLETIERIQANFFALLENCLSEPECSVEDFSSVCLSEREQLLAMGAPAQPTSEIVPVLVPYRIEQLARSQPTSPAILHGETSLSYSDLNHQASLLAMQLRTLGVRKEKLVGVCMERSTDLIVALLAIWKAGGAYLPIDPSLPEARKAFIIEDSAPDVILCSHASHHSFKSLMVHGTLHIFETLAHAAEGAAADVSTLEPVSGQDLAYVIYTSGSTGQPKGVQIEHQQIARLIDTCEPCFQFSSSDVWSFFHSYAFDFSVWEIWGALSTGGSVAIVPEGIRHDPAQFYAMCCDQGVTILSQTPSAFRSFMLAQADTRRPHTIRTVVFGGEALSPSMLSDWFAHPYNTDCKVVNMYGITETTVHVTYAELTPENIDSYSDGSPIGRQLDDLSLYLLDEHRELVPFGAVGELYVGGAGVARGYLNRPDLNAERFIESPFSAKDRLYKTGDLARYVADGTMLYLGRNDSQVKVRGYRIELGEIEAALATHEALQHVVVTCQNQATSDAMLVAYYVSTSANADLNSSSLQSFAAGLLPAYMVPAAFIELDALPLTANGKLDRKALDKHKATSTKNRAFESPEGEHEELLANVWADILQLEKVSRLDSFFELGGHSLLAARVQAAMRAKGLLLAAVDVLRWPTLKDLAQRIQPVEPKSLKSNSSESSPAMSLSGLSQTQIKHLASSLPGGFENVEDIYPLTPLQEGIYFHHQLSEEGDPYLLWSLMTFETPQALQDYTVALQEVMDRHDILRTVFVSEGLEKPLQVVLKNVNLKTVELDADALKGSGDIAERLQAHFAPRTTKVDLQEPSLLRVYTCYDTDNDRWLLLKLFHHIIDDNTSLKQLNAEVKAFMVGDGNRLETPAQFKEYVAFQQEESTKGDARNFFSELFRGLEAPNTPLGLGVDHVHGSDLDTDTTHTDTALTSGLREVASQLGVSTASIFHFVWALVMAKCSGQEDVCFATVLLGRLQGLENAERILGPFINTLPLRVNLTDQDWKSALLAVHQTLLDLMDHEYASLADAIEASGVDRTTPLISSLVNFRHAQLMSDGSQGSSHRDLPGANYIAGHYGTSYPFNLTVDDFGTSFKVQAQAPHGSFASSLLHMTLGCLQRLIQVHSKAEQTPAHQLVQLDTDQTSKLLEFAEGAEFEEASTTLHSAFEAVAVDHGTQVALVGEGAQLTYGQLNSQANQLARYLVAQGVSSQSRVAVCLQNSANAVVGLLAILKAGGAYIPIDPTYPSERISYLIEDSTPVLVLCDAASISELREITPPAKLVNVGQQEPPWQSLDDENLNAPVSSEDTAYVIYTSGTTGKPKGVVVPHKGPANLMAWFLQEGTFTLEDKVLLSTSLTFDISVVEVFASLSCGATVVIADRARLLEGNYLVELIAEQQVTVCQFVPSLLDFFLSCENVSACTSLRSILCGGEAFPSRLAERCFKALGSIHLQNLYGPTEASVYCTRLELDYCAEYPPVVPIGQPIAGMKMYILDRHLDLVPVGVAGDLYVAGPGVAKGYLNRPELTVERFIPSPFKAGERLYQTGDVGRYLEDGTIEYLGRDDFQIKVRGYRIEPGEIEHALSQFDGILNAVVVAHADQAGSSQLVAYVCMQQNAAELDTTAMRGALANQLPDYMVPALYVQLDDLPLTSNGKIDRSQLPTPTAHSIESVRNYVAPETPLEEELARIWAEVLQLDGVGIRDNFFEIGGHSLRATRITARMQDALGVEVPLRIFFERPTIEQTLDYIFEELEAAEEFS